MKTKTKGKPNRKRWLIGVVFILASACILTLMHFVSLINSEPRYDVPILNDIDNVFSNSLVEARILEYLIIGSSTRAEVETFGAENLASQRYPCHPVNEVTQTCYNVNRRPFWGCEYYLLRIVFVFREDVLNAIEFETIAKCL